MVSRLAIFMVLFVPLLIASPVKAQAQTQPHFSQFEVDLWPEYDRPAVLVIYKIVLAPDTTFPANLAIRIPVEAGEPSAVAVGESDDSLFNVVYTRDIQEKWAYIRLTAAMPAVRLEYYDPRIVKKGSGRHFEYNWPGDYEIDDLLVQIQQPLGVSKLDISPIAENFSSYSDDTLTYYGAQLGSLKAGEPFTLTVDYEKSFDELSVTGLKVEPITPISQNTTGRVTWISTPLIVLLTLGLVLVIAGGIWYSRSRSHTMSMPRRRRRKIPREAAEATVAGDDEPVIYCYQCGKRANPDDRFCRVCGTRLRIGSD